LIKFAQQAEKGGQYLDAYLAFAEYSLMKVSHSESVINP
jgi:hypothetical protein